MSKSSEELIAKLKATKAKLNADKLAHAESANKLFGTTQAGEMPMGHAAGGPVGGPIGDSGPFYVDGNPYYYSSAGGVGQYHYQEHFAPQYKSGFKDVGVVMDDGLKIKSHTDWGGNVIKTVLEEDMTITGYGYVPGEKQGEPWCSSLIGPWVHIYAHMYLMPGMTFNDYHPMMRKCLKDHAKPHGLKVKEINLVEVVVLPNDPLGALVTYKGVAKPPEYAHLSEPPGLTAEYMGVQQNWIVGAPSVVEEMNQPCDCADDSEACCPKCCEDCAKAQAVVMAQKAKAASTVKGKNPFAGLTTESQKVMGLIDPFAEEPKATPVPEPKPKLKLTDDCDCDACTKTKQEIAKLPKPEPDWSDDIYDEPACLECDCDDPFCECW